MLDDEAERLVEPLVRVAFGQQPQMPGKRLQAVDGGRAVEQPRRVELEGFRLERAEMFVEPRPPQNIDPVAGLQHGLLLARAPAPDEAEMPAMQPRHHLKDGAGLAMLAGAENDSLVAPFHRCSLSRLRGRNQG